MSGIAIINGPNLASLGVREPMIYGDTSSLELNSLLVTRGRDAGFSISFQQIDVEGLMVEAINNASKNESISALIINPGGFSHTSVAVLDAMRAFPGPVVEVHISQIHKREPYRHRMLTAGGAEVIISGAGIHGYFSAIEIVKELLRR
ncbi:MAG: 3-dehydroquinate dehydratase [Candidatus Sabulitectum sp.]|nr:3-dehydroquinate dehydratase [Candidatus Sabulitectum sp.]